MEGGGGESGGGDGALEEVTSFLLSLRCVRNRRRVEDSCHYKERDGMSCKVKGKVDENERMEGGRRYQKGSMEYFSFLDLLWNTKCPEDENEVKDGKKREERSEK